MGTICGLISEEMEGVNTFLDGNRLLQSAFVVNTVPLYLALKLGRNVEEVVQGVIKKVLNYPDYQIALNCSLGRRVLATDLEKRGDIWGLLGSHFPNQVKPFLGVEAAVEGTARYFRNQVVSFVDEFAGTANAPRGYAPPKTKQ